MNVAPGKGGEAKSVIEPSATLPAAPFTTAVIGTPVTTVSPSAIAARCVTRNWTGSPAELRSVRTIAPASRGRVPPCARITDSPWLWKRRVGDASWSVQYVPAFVFARYPTGPS